MVVHRLNIRGIEVLFPFKPYQCQLNYMDKVIQCLNESLEDRETNGREHCVRTHIIISQNQHFSLTHTRLDFFQFFQRLFREEMPC